MSETQIKGQLNKLDTFREFAEEFSLSKRDLIMTCGSIYRSFIEGLGLDSQIVFREKFLNL